MLNRETNEFIAYFIRAHPARTLLLVFLLVLSGLAEGVGVVTLLPLVEVAAGTAAAEQSAISGAVIAALASVGLPPHLAILLGIIVVGMFLKGAFRLLAMKQVGYAVAHVGTDLRLALIDALLRTRWRYFTSQRTGRFANAVGTEAMRASNAYRALCTFVASLIQALVYASIAVLVSWRIAVFGIIAGGLVVLALRRFVGMSWVAGREQTYLLRSLVARLTDALNGIKPIKAMAREKHLQPLLERETRDLNRAQERNVLATEAAKSSQEPILTLLMAVALYFAISVAEIAFSTVLVLGVLFYRLAGRIGLLQTDYQTIAVAQSAFWSLRESVESAEREREVSEGREPPPEIREGIRFESVAFAFDEVDVLSDASFELPAGRFATLIGPSGAGKTTIADLLVGLHQPKSGRILIDGVSLDRLDLLAWRTIVGYVPQEMFLFHDTLLHNVTLGDPEVARSGAEQALRAAGAWEFVRDLPDGLDTVMGERGSKLSGGQRQRVALARALIRRPRLLILDEVTTALDPRTEAAICDTLRSFKGGMTILAISHQPTIARAADLVLELSEGRVFERERIHEEEHGAPVAH